MASLGVAWMRLASDFVPYGLVWFGLSQYGWLALAGLDWLNCVLSWFRVARLGLVWLGFVTDELSA